MKRGVKITIAVLLGLIVVLFATSIVSIKIDLPPAEPAKVAGPVLIGMQPNGQLTVDGKPTTLETLTPDVAARFAGVPKGAQRILIRAPGDVEYADFKAVLDSLKAHGWTKVGLINESPAEPEPQSSGKP